MQAPSFPHTIVLEHDAPQSEIRAHCESTLTTLCPIGSAITVLSDVRVWDPEANRSDRIARQFTSAKEAAAHAMRLDEQGRGALFAPVPPESGDSYLRTSVRPLHRDPRAFGAAPIGAELQMEMFFVAEVVNAFFVEDHGWPQAFVGFNGFGIDLISRVPGSLDLDDFVRRVGPYLKLLSTDDTMIELSDAFDQPLRVYGTLVEGLGFPPPKARSSVVLAPEPLVTVAVGQARSVTDRVAEFFFGNDE